MQVRPWGLLPAAVALLAVGVAHAQPASTGGGGSMAYPDSLPSGQFRVTAPTAPDTGSMAYPASPGGVRETAPTGPDVGNMALPTNGGRVVRPGAATPASSGAAPATSRAASRGAPVQAPSASGRQAAADLALKPSDAPVPYVDFGTPAAPAPVKGSKGMHHAVLRHTVKKGAAKPAPAASPAAATPAPAPAAK